MVNVSILFNMTKPIINYEYELKVAREAAQKARAVLLNHYGRLSQVSEKFQAGLVSEADKNSEKVIQTHLKDACPQYSFLGEESSYENNNANLTANLDKGQWVVDPLDGTTNYIHSFPIFCISIALVVNKTPVVGVIDVPILNDTYWAVRGGGVYKNGNPIRVSSSQKLKGCLAATGFFAEKEEGLEEQLQLFSKIIRKVRAVRRPGAAAFDLCMVASGVFDFFWEKDLSPWDVAAGQLLIEEAGGLVTNYAGGKYDPWQKTILASNSHIYQDLLKEFSESKA